MASSSSYSDKYYSSRGHLEIDSLDLDQDEITRKNKLRLMTKKFQGKNISLVLGVISVILSMCMYVCLKYLFDNARLTPMEGMYLRGIGDLILTVIFAFIFKVDVLNIKESQRSVIKWRMIFGVLSSASSFYAFYINELAMATTLIFISPIFTVIIARFYLNEKISRWDFMNILASGAGVFLIYDPFTWEVATNVTSIGVAIGMVAALFVAASLIMARRANTELHFFTPMFYFNLSTSFFAPIAYYIQQIIEPSLVIYSNKSIFIIVLMCLFGFLSQIFMNASYKNEKASRIASLRFIQIALSFVADIFLFKTSYYWNELLGAALIVSINLVIVIIRR